VNDHTPLSRLSREPVAPPAAVSAPIPISEEAFHWAIHRAADYTCSLAGDTFLIPAPTGVSAFIRVNNRHFRVQADRPVSHAELLRQLGNASVWKDGHGR